MLFRVGFRSGFRSRAMKEKKIPRIKFDPFRETKARTTHTRAQTHTHTRTTHTRKQRKTTTMKPSSSSSFSSSSTSKKISLLVFFVFFFFFVGGTEGEIAGLGGIQRGSNRVEYADGAFNVRNGGKGGRELQINTHSVKTRSEWQFWEQVQCREKLFLGKDEDKVEVGERLATIFAKMESLTKDVAESNADLRAENADLRAALVALEAKVDTLF